MIILFVEAREHIDINKMRKAEFCFAKNLSNPLIDKIIINKDYPFDKVVKGDIKDFPDDICIVAPDDVYANDTLKYLYHIDWDKGITLEIGNVTIFKGQNSKDNWIFNPSDIVFEGNIQQGNITSHRMEVIKTKPIPKIGHIGMYKYLKQEHPFVEYKFINWTEYCHNWKMNAIKKKEFEEACINMAMWADILSIQTQTDNIIKLPLIQHIKKIKKEIKIYQWTGDVREEIPLCFMEIAKDTVSLFSNDNDTQIMRGKGFKSEYLNIGYPDDIFYPKGYKAKSEPIVFMGNNYGDKAGKPHFPLSHVRRDMVNYLKGIYGTDFGVYGNGWNGIETADIKDQHIEAATYRNAKIAINYSHFFYSRYSSDRIFRIMGSGCFCLSHKYPDIEKDFVIGKHLDIFTTFDELKQKIDYYMEHDEERATIAKQGADYVYNNCTWTHRITQLLKMNI